MIATEVHCDGEHPGRKPAFGTVSLSVQVNAHKSFLRELNSIAAIVCIARDEIENRFFPPFHDCVQREVVSIAQSVHEVLV